MPSVSALRFIVPIRLTVLTDRTWERWHFPKAMAGPPRARTPVLANVDGPPSGFLGRNGTPGEGEA